MVMQDNFRVVVLIPAYKPDERLIQLTRKLAGRKARLCCWSMNGGGEQYAHQFLNSAARWAQRLPCMRSIRARDARSRPD